MGGGCSDRLAFGWRCFTVGPALYAGLLRAICKFVATWWRHDFDGCYFDLGVRGFWLGVTSCLRGPAEKKAGPYVRRGALRLYGVGLLQPVVSSCWSFCVAFSLPFFEAARRRTRACAQFCCTPSPRT